MRVEKLPCDWEDCAPKLHWHTFIQPGNQLAISNNLLVANYDPKAWIGSQNHKHLKIDPGHVSSTNDDEDLQSRDKRNTPSAVSCSKEEMKINFQDVSMRKNASKLPLSTKYGLNFSLLWHASQTYDFNLEQQEYCARMYAYETWERETELQRSQIWGLKDSPKIGLMSYWHFILNLLACSQ